MNHWITVKQVPFRSLFPFPNRIPIIALCHLTHPNTIMTRYWHRKEARKSALSVFQISFGRSNSIRTICENRKYTWNTGTWWENQNQNQVVSISVLFSISFFKSSCTYRLWSYFCHFPSDQNPKKNVTSCDSHGYMHLSLIIIISHTTTKQLPRYLLIIIASSQTSFLKSLLNHFEEQLFAISHSSAISFLRS